MNKDDKDALLSELVSYLEAEGETFTLDGPLMVTVKLPDNTYRRKTVERTDFYLESIYSGQKDTIFVFQFDALERPASAEFNIVEIASKDMDGAFPMFLERMIAWARLRFAPSDASRLQPINSAETVRALLNMILNFEKDDNTKAEADVEDTLATLPMFGMF